MERMSDKHSPMLDEEMKQETDSLRRGAPVESRAQESREKEGPAEDEPTPDVLVNGDRDLPLPDNALSPEEANHRTELARHLPMGTFPARTGELVDAARANHAPGPACAALAELPDRLWDNVAEVWEALGGRVEHRA